MLTDLEKNAISEHYRILAANLPGFRPRTAQRQMLAAVAQAFARSLPMGEDGTAPTRQGESIVVIEGPTGVGKSLAYLLAGSVMAQARGKKLLVTSATIALQEQLIFRDLPFLAENSGLAVSYALAKGRGRYLCPYRLYQITQDTAQAEFTGFDSRALLPEKIAAEDADLLHDMAEAFAARTFDGDRDTWLGQINDKLWSRVTNDRHGCLKNACPNRAECPFFLARDTLENVDVIVANHDLLLSDISMGGGVILPAPEQCFYCIDEAHHLPKKAVSRFAAEHGLNEARQFLERLPSVTDRIAACTDKAEAANLADEAAAGLAEALADWETVLNQSDVFPETLSAESVWLWEGGTAPDGLQENVARSAQFARALLKQVYVLNDALAQTRRDTLPDMAMLDRLASEFGVALARCEEIAAVWDLLEQTHEAPQPPLAKWLVLDRRDKPDYRFNASPVTAAGQLAHQLWQRAAGALLTSATLRALGNFDLLLSQCGLNRLPETTTLALDSPFDFERQAELYIPPLAANPKDAAAHTEEIVTWLPRLIDSTHAVGTLVLFSSRKQMEEVAFRLPEAFLPLLLVQGERSKSLLLQAHHQALSEGRASIIFGLDSFAEGLDLPGEACVQVIIAKLPFAMPDNPVDKTLSEWIREKGGNPFMEISVPEAAIKLTQAVGRLIRSESDYGRVTILDTRILTARYGKRILAALPPFRRI
ncbi:MAG: ATP-dependent DNA helicase DinG [Neisseria sp.]|nr:ATP-dependent DNA helicase DinG [Neisseria sp.]